MSTNLRKDGNAVIEKIHQFLLRQCQEGEPVIEGEGCSNVVFADTTLRLHYVSIAIDDFRIGSSYESAPTCWHN